MTRAPRKGAGRPRSIDLETLLDVAATMDLSALSMKAVAQRLGVGVATLYRYAKDRETLVRLASAKAAHRPPPADVGQPWQDVVAGYAGSIFSGLSSAPTLLHAYLDGHLGAELEVEFADSFAAAMRSRGFGEAQTMEIFRAMGLLAVGAAAATLHMRAQADARGDFGRTTELALAQREAGELPHLRAALTEYVTIAGHPDLGPAVTLMIAGITPPGEITNTN